MTTEQGSGDHLWGEAEAIAARLREQVAAAIERATIDAEAERKRILAEAHRDAERVRAEAEAEREHILAQAHQAAKHVAGRGFRGGEPSWVEDPRPPEPSPDAEDRQLRRLPRSWRRFVQDDV